MRKILVTGGLGFVGSHLVERLLAGGDDVTVVDSQASAVVDAEAFGARCRVLRCDLADLAPDGTVYHEIYHLADVAGPARILSFAGMIAKKAIDGVVAVMRSAKTTETRLVLVSSSEVYGRPGCYNEADPAIIYTPYTVRLEYAVAKSLCEISALNWARIESVAVNIVRPFNIAGPRQSSIGGFVLPRFFEAALSGSPITVFGDGRQVRCFTHVADTVESLIAVARSECRGEIFNSGNPENKITIAELAALVRDVCRSNSPIIYVDPRQIYGPLYAEAFDKVPRIDKIRSRTDWVPTRSLSDILTDMLHAYESGTSTRFERVTNVGPAGASGASDALVPQPPATTFEEGILPRRSDRNEALPHPMRHDPTHVSGSPI